MEKQNILALILVPILFLGCAYEKLTLRLDIYNEKPQESKPITAAIAQIVSNIEPAIVAASNLPPTKIEGEEFGKKGEADLNNQDRMVENQQAIMIDRLKNYRVVVQQYAKSVDKADISKLNDAFREVKEAGDKLKGSLKSETGTNENQLDSPNVPVNGIGTNIVSTGSEAGLQTQGLGATNSPTKKDKEPHHLVKAKDQKVKPKTNTGQTNEVFINRYEALENNYEALVSATQNSELERMQDSADPNWRVVTDPRNAKKWNAVMATNLFYAEGNSGVIIVRDSPIRYRIQRGNNNPAALVQSQLQISRAVADAAIEVAGAATGVRLPVSRSVSSTNSGSIAGVPDIEETDVEKRYTLEERARVREATRRYLIVEMASLRTRLSNTNLSTVEKSQLIRELRSLLQGVEPIFQTSTAK